jgi:2,5-diamino-6-(ribosylamino)-4(3H)-pyrimidinone 5'-phosphate reductase
MIEQTLRDFGQMGARMIPRVILHTAVSADGRTTGFAPDIGVYYSLAQKWREDATLTGADTILAAQEAASSDDPGETAQAHEPGDTRPLLAVVDSRGRVRCWRALREAGLWRRMIALVSESTPREYLDYLAERHVEAIAAGEQRVDLRSALGELAARHGTRTVRADSGGTLNAALLAAGLVSEVSLLVHPVLVGGSAAHTAVHCTEPLLQPATMSLAAAEQLEGGLLWIRYESEK